MLLGGRHVGGGKGHVRPKLRFARTRIPAYRNMLAVLGGEVRRLFLHSSAYRVLVYSYIG